MSTDHARLQQHLCRRYPAAVLSTSSYLQECDLRRSRRSIEWMLGWLMDGRADVLAVWQSESESDSAAPLAFEDVRRRGTEFIGVGVGVASHAEAEFKRVFRSSTVLTSIEQEIARAQVAVAPEHRSAIAGALRRTCSAATDVAARSLLQEYERSPLGAAYPEVMAQWCDLLAKSKATFALPSELRQMVTSADCGTADVRARLARAIQRHGPFFDDGAARDFVTAALRRAERRLDRDHAARGAVQGAA